MDHQPLNTAEQKDMAEFFIDLVSKLEEMTPDLKSVIKKLFCGIISNNVVSLVSDSFKFTNFSWVNFSSYIYFHSSNYSI